MVDQKPTLSHDLFEVTVAESIAQIPPHTEYNDFSLEMTPLEEVLVAHREDLFHLFLFTLPDQLSSCNTTTIIPSKFP